MGKGGEGRGAAGACRLVEVLLARVAGACVACGVLGTCGKEGAQVGRTRPQLLAVSAACSQVTVCVRLTLRSLASFGKPSAAHLTLTPSCRWLSPWPCRPCWCGPPSCCPRTLRSCSGTCPWWPLTPGGAGRLVQGGLGKVGRAGQGPYSAIRVCLVKPSVSYGANALACVAARRSSHNA